MMDTYQHLPHDYAPKQKERSLTQSSLLALLLAVLLVVVVDPILDSFGG